MLFHATVMESIESESEKNKKKILNSILFFSFFWNCADPKTYHATVMESIESEMFIFLAYVS